MKQRINICGVSYSIRLSTAPKDSELTDSRGYCDFLHKKIVINADDIKEQKLETTRHEILHAFFGECGLTEYGSDETLIDFLAMQLPKIFALCKELKII